MNKTSLFPWFGTFALVWMQPPRFDVNQISRPRPPWTAGLGSLPNEPWYGSLEMWKPTHIGPIQFYKAYATLDVTGTSSAARIMGIIVWLAATPRLAANCIADAFNTFSTRMREKEFDRSTTVSNKSLSRVQPAGYPWLFRRFSQLFYLYPAPDLLSLQFYRQHLCT